MTTEAITPLRQRMIEDMDARKLCAGTERGHIRACKRFAAFLTPGLSSSRDLAGPVASGPQGTKVPYLYVWLRSLDCAAAAKTSLVRTFQRPSLASTHLHPMHRGS
jgi:hypothetical protein